MKFIIYMVSVIVLGLCLSPRHDPARAAEQIQLAMTADHWTTMGEVEFVQHDGYAALQLKPGNYAEHKMTGQAVLNDFTFRNGTIEYDVEALGSMGAGIGFRRRDRKIPMRISICGPVQIVPRQWTARNTRHERTAFCSGTFFRSIKRPHLCAKASGTTSRW